MTEVSERYGKLSQDFADRLAQVKEDCWDNPSPCDEWKTRDVAKHVIDNHAMFIGDKTGLTPLADDDDPVAKWQTAREAMDALLNDPEKSQGITKTPLGEMPLETFVGRILSTDILVHTWDLSRAAGLDERIDADAVHHAYEGLKPLDAMIRQPGIFGPKIEPAEGDDEQTQFLKFLGRKV